MNYELLHPGSKTKNPPSPGNRNSMERICKNCGQRYGAHYGSGDSESLCPVLNLSSMSFQYPYNGGEPLHDMHFEEGGTINYEEKPRNPKSFLDDALFELD